MVDEILFFIAKFNLDRCLKDSIAEIFIKIMDAHFFLGILVSVHQVGIQLPK